MAIVEPFAALRPQPDLAPRVAELPYDVMSSDEARQRAAGNPLSFLRVSKPEIELPPGTNPYSPEVYARGGECFRRLIADGVLRPDAQPCFYIYQQVMGGHCQVGFVAVVSCQDYLGNTVKKHELTRVDKEDDRVRHLEALNAQTGPAFLLYRATGTLEAMLARKTVRPPDIDFTAPDSVRHTCWTIADQDTIARIRAAFREVPNLYIADGHHRTAAAARVFQARQGAGRSGFFLAVLFPHDQVQLLPYHRAVMDLNGLTPEAFLERLRSVFSVLESGTATPRGQGEVALYLSGRWHLLKFKPELAAARDPLESLDVSLLQRHVLAPLLGIDDPRRSERLHFVGGIRRTPELERLVKGGECVAAFSMHPTSVDDLLAVADAGGIMPPKSTWFEPKLRDGLFCHGL
jgi:uncharacterized protein (DUF1015 family)